MKKVININFQGRVIPIEETAYEMLKQYVESLRRYFAREEGRDEIINDIENRIAELFDERLKKGAVCISDEHVNAVMASMGRPEDFEEQDIVDNDNSYEQAKSHTESSRQQGGAYSAQEEPRKLRRAENDTVLGGVCAGIAHYLRIDPAVVRIIFALIAFAGFGFGFLLYVILWIVLPAAPLQTNVRKRLYRDPDNKMVGGVASGLAAYFNIDTWIPRLIFLIPFIISIMPNLFGSWNYWGPKLAFGGLGGTFFITYIILWIVLPRATTATEKLEMRGEKIDLESIKNTVQEELHGAKGKAEKTVKDFSAKATNVGMEISRMANERSEEISRMATEKGKAFAAEVRPVAKKVGTGIGNAIGVLFKAFFLFIAAIIAFSLMMVLVALMYSGIGMSLFQNFLLEGFWQNFIAWSVIILFIGVPVIALLVWVARRIMRVKSHNPYLGYTFGSLWIVGLISVFVLVGMVGRNFRTRTSVTEDVAITQPAGDGMVVKVKDSKLRYYTSDLFKGDFPFLSQNEDSLLLNTVKIRLVKSEDTAYHINLVKLSRGGSPAKAEENATDIVFAVNQQDSIVTLPKGFPVSKKNKFRNQQVMVVMEVPVGKRIMIDRSANWYNWFEVNIDGRREVNIDWDSKWDNSYSWKTNVVYVMTESGLERVDKAPEENKKSLKNGRFKMKADENGVEIEAEGELEGEDSGTYRYRRQKPASVAPTEKPAAPKGPVTAVDYEEATPKKDRMVKTEPGFHNPFIFFLGKIR